jgi:hypothetical protein
MHDIKYIYDYLGAYYIYHPESGFLAAKDGESELFALWYDNWEILHRNADRWSSLLFTIHWILTDG